MDLYRKIFEARRLFQKLWDRKIEDDVANQHISELKNYQTEVFANQILLDKEIYEYFKNIFGGMLAVSLNIRMELDVELKETREIKERITTVTNLIRDRFGLESIPRVAR